MANQISQNILGTKVAPVTAVGAAACIRWQGGEGTIFVKGTWGGTLFKLQYSPISSALDADFFDLDASTVMSANGAFNFQLPPGFLRAVLVSGTGISLWGYIRSY